MPIDELSERLERWSYLAQKAFEGNWDQCSLLHSFGDKLAADLREAVARIENLENNLKK